MAKLWRCEICGDPYIGENAPDNCPFCGAHKKYIKPANEARVTFDVPITTVERANIAHALLVEVSNSTFYFCAAGKTDDAEGKLLFKALGKIEAEHANIWRKLLKYDNLPKGDDQCHVGNKENLAESHERETKAIDFYRTAARESVNERVKQIFTALVEIETDHLHLSGERMK